MTAPVFSIDDFLAGLQGLMPRGPIWQSDPNSVQGKLERGLVTSWARLNGVDAQLLEDAFPATAEFLLPEWEAALGLPDPCAGAAPTIEQRRQQVVARLTDKGGLSSARFIALAQSLGYAVSTEMFAPFRAGQSHAGDPLGGSWSFFTWQVDGPLVTPTYFRAGSGHAGEPLRSWGNAVLECEIAASAPAHTAVKFAYGYDLPEGFGLNFETGTYYTRAINGPPVVYDNLADFFTVTRSTIATYRDNTGLLRTAPINVPRVDYALDGSCLGFLSEMTATNLILQSEQFGAPWGGTGMTTVNTDVAIAPDGNLTADNFVEGVGGTFHYMAQNFTAVNAQSFVASVFVKKKERKYAQIQLGGVNFGNQATLIDLDTGALVFGNGGTGDAEYWGNGWWRVWVTAIATGTAGAALVLLGGTGNPSYAGDGTSGVYAWGAQVELGTYPSSYIKTLGATGTRGGDVCYRSIGGEFNFAEGTVVAELTTSPAQNATTSQFIWNFDDLTGAERIGLLRPFTTDLAAMRVFDGGVLQVALDQTPAPANRTFVKSAVAWKLNDFAHSMNGAAPLTSNTGTLPTPTTFSLGISAPLGANEMNGRIKKLTYYPTRKSNAELQALST